MITGDSCLHIIASPTPNEAVMGGPSHQPSVSHTFAFALSFSSLHTPNVRFLEKCRRQAAGDRRWQVPPHPGLEAAGSSLLRGPRPVYKSPPTASPLNPEGHRHIRGRAVPVAGRAQTGVRFAAPVTRCKTECIGGKRASDRPKDLHAARRMFVPDFKK